MSLMALYITAFLIGAGLITFTLVVGNGDADADGPADVDGGEVGEADAVETGGVGDLLGWLPITSLRFWTFFAAGFGATGAALLASGFGSGLSLGAAIPVGYIAGTGFSLALRRLAKSETDSSLGERDYVGALGTVVLPIGRESTGKVRLSLKGRTVELLANTEDDELLREREQVMVYGVKPDGNVLVSRDRHSLPTE